MHNLHVNAVRRARSEGTRVHVEDLADRLPSPPQQHTHLHLRAVARALADLPEEQRQVILLVGLESMSYKDTAQVIGVPVGTVMSRLARGRTALQRLVDGETTTPAVRRVK